MKTSSTISYTSPLPPPSTFGVDKLKFPEWRVFQADAVMDIISSPSRYNLLVAGTGFGKSLSYLILCLTYGGRALILTSTKALQHQLITDFSGMGIIEIKGKGNYRCKRLPDDDSACDKGPCNYNQNCEFKSGGCFYYDQVYKARQSQIVITNYSYWTYLNKALLSRRGKGGDGQDEYGIGDFDLIICDEAHDVPDRVADAYSIRFSSKNLVENQVISKFKWTNSVDDWSKWAIWAQEHLKTVLSNAKRDSKTMIAYKANNALRKIKEGLGYIETVGKDQIVVVPDKKWGVLRIAVIWPYEIGREVLFPGSVKKVVFTSATVRPKTVNMLGIGEGEFELFEYPHSIPVNRRMLTHIPCIYLNYRTKPIQLREWVSKADRIIRPRIDIGWNGLFHTVSYSRRDTVLRDSRVSQYMMSASAQDMQSQIEKFKRSQGMVFVHPALTTGYDFPYDTCRFQIIGKLPFPDRSDPVVKLRSDRDKEYSPYTTMQTLIQTCGRIVRAPNDWGETFCIDNTISKFIWKYKKFAPDWFHGSYRSMDRIPKPGNY